MILADAIIVCFSFFLAHFLRHHFHALYKLDLFPSAQMVGDFSGTVSDYLVVLFLVVPLWCGLFYLNGLYHSLSYRKISALVWTIFKSSFLAAFASGFLIFLFKLEFISRMFFIIFVTVCSASILFEKIVIFSVSVRLRRRGYSLRRIIIVGKGRRAASFVNKIKNHPEWGIKLIGALDDEPAREVGNFKELKIIGTLKNLPEILHRQAVDEVVFIVPRLRLNYIQKAIYTCQTEGIKATIAVDLFDLRLARARQTEIDGLPLLTFDISAAREWQLLIKRAADVVISGLGLILLSPFLLIVAILVKLSSSGPVLFKQKRVGLNGRKFILYKFRTMRNGAQQKLKNIDIFNEMNDPSFRKKKIQYITPVGRVLRKLSIDELPQLFNVFVGHMSLIGPRPPLPEEVKQYKPWQRRRLSMRPGLTCLWQINGRNKLNFNQWMKLDLEYLDNWSLWLDFKILIKTIPVVFFGVGAY